AVVCCISEPSAEYAAQITQALKKQGFRVESDLRGEKITRKIREHSLQKVPYILVVGEKERQEGKVAVRGLGGLDLGAIPFDEFVARLSEDVSSRRDVVPATQPEAAAV
ncbi:MAG: threonine--tRNA ligase, partial [Alcaligenaceae bacterium]